MYCFVPIERSGISGTLIQEEEKTALVPNAAQVDAGRHRAARTKLGRVVPLAPQLEVHHQSRGDSRDDLVPTPRPLLSENSHRRIPRRVLALEHPEPFGFEAI